MKTITYSQFGSTEVLQFSEESKPAVQSSQVLVKIKAVSVNPLDWKIRKGEMKLMSGSRFPKHTGTDFSGIIEETGTAVSGFKKGDEVFGVVKNNMKDGALMEYIAVNVSQVWKKPSAISFSQAASIPTVGAAAVTAIEKTGKLTAASSVLVIGATGGVGMFLLQLLKDSPASVTAVAGANSLAQAKAWGATRVVDYRKENVLTQAEKYDIVIDLSAKTGYARAKQLMKPTSLFLNLVPRPVEIPLSLLNNLFTRKRHVVILSAPSSKNMQVLSDAIDKGLNIEVSKTFPFAKSREAYQYAEQGGFPGKVTIEID